MKYDNTELIDALAAEYVLGTLQGRARSRFQHLLVQRPHIRQAVSEWEQRLDKLAGREPGVRPPADTWPALEQRLFGAHQSRTTPPRWYERLAFWRGFSIGSSLLAATLAAWLVIYYPHDTQSGYVLVLNDAQVNPVWTASVGRNLDSVRINNLKPMPMPENKGCVLWVQPEGSDTMYPLGRLPDDGGTAQLTVTTQLQQMLRNGKLMVTIEEIDQTVIEKPSGKVEFVGRLAPLQSI